MHRRRLLAEEVPGAIMGSGSLRDLAVRLRLDSVDQIWELDCILDEENGNVVTDDVCHHVRTRVQKMTS